MARLCRYQTGVWGEFMNTLLLGLALAASSAQAAENTQVSTAAAAAAKPSAEAIKEAAGKARQTTGALIEQRSAELLEKLQGKRPMGKPKAPPKALPAEAQVLQYCKEMETGDYAQRKAAFYKIYPLRISFTEGWFKFPADKRAKGALINLLNRELDYQNPPPSLPRRPCRGDGCSRYLMDALTAVASIRSEVALPVLIKSYSGLAGFGGFVHLAVTQHGDAALPPLKLLYDSAHGEEKDRALFSLLALLKGGGWYGDVRISTATASVIAAIAEQELKAPTAADNLRRKSMATRMLRIFDGELQLNVLASSVYQSDDAVRKECVQAYVGGMIDKDLLRYLRLEAPPGTDTAPAAAKEKGK